GSIRTRPSRSTGSASRPRSRRPTRRGASGSRRRRPRPIWYTTAHIERLIGAYIKHDADNGRERTVRELVAEFRGLSATAKQKRVLDATGLARAPLSALLRGDGFDRGKIERLLAAMKANSAPVKPAILGSIGKEHFRKRFAAAGCEMET